MRWPTHAGLCSAMGKGPCHICGLDVVSADEFDSMLAADEFVLLRAELESLKAWRRGLTEHVAGDASDGLTLHHSPVLSHFTDADVDCEECIWISQNRQGKLNALEARLAAVEAERAAYKAALERIAQRVGNVYRMRDLARTTLDAFREKEAEG